MHKTPLLIIAGVFVSVLPLQVRAANIIINTEPFQMISDVDSASDLSLIFGNALNKKITYERVSQQYVLDDDVVIQGNISTENDLSASGGLIVVGDSRIGRTPSGAPLLTLSGSRVGIGNEAPPNLLSVGDGVLSSLNGYAIGVSNLNGDSIVSVGQGPSDRGRIKWIYNANAENGYTVLGDSSGTHPLVLQDSGGNVGIHIINPKTTLEVGGTVSGALLTVSGLNNCDTIDTDANGNFSCGTDQTGSGPATVASTADVTTSSSAADSTVTGLSIPVTANTNYIINCWITSNAAATTTGVQVTVNGPSSPTQVTWTRNSCSSATAVVHASINAFGSRDSRTASAGSTRCIDALNINLQNGNQDGNVTFAVRSEVSSSNVTIFKGSYCTYQTY
jgi:hypothetical protein